MIRGRYNKIPLQDCQRLINAYQNGQDYIAVARILGIKHQTANSIMRNFQRTGRIEAGNKGGARNVKMSEDMKQFLVNIIEEKSTITLKEMKSQMELQRPDWPHVTVQCISKALDGELITIKQLRNIPQQRNSDFVKLARREYMLWWTEEAVHNQLVYVDECGFNLYTSRTQGRAERGFRAVRQIAMQRGQNITVSLAVSPQYGVVHYSIKRGGANIDSFAGFLMEISTLMIEESIVIIADNAPAHNTPPALNDGHLIKFLPQYSPFLNIVENSISVFKAALKRRLTEPNIKIDVDNRELAENAGITLHEHRCRILEHEMLPCIAEITVECCRNFNNHVNRYALRCLDLADIHVDP